MYLQGLLYPAFVLATTAVRLDERQNDASVSPTAQPPIGGLAPATTLFPTGPIPSGDPDFDPSVGTDMNGPPDAEDIAWVNAFMDGEPIDPLLDFYAHDLINEDDGNPNDGDSDDAVVTAATNITAMNETSVYSNTLMTALVVERTKFAFAMAHYRARQRNAGLNSSDSLPQAEDWQWLQSFWNGGDVDEDLIWNAADLEAPAYNTSNDEELISAADFQDSRVEAAALAMSRNETASNQLLAKRGHSHHHHHHGYKHPPKNALQVLRRAQRAARRARHRARVKRHKIAMRRHKEVVERHRAAVKRHKEAVERHKKAAARKAAAKRREQLKKHHSQQHTKHKKSHPSKPYPKKDYGAKGNLKHGVVKCGHPVPWGYLCDGNVDCHWWCVRGVMNCGMSYNC